MKLSEHIQKNYWKLTKEQLKQYVLESLWQLKDNLPEERYEQVCLSIASQVEGEIKEDEED